MAALGGYLASDNTLSYEVVDQTLRANLDPSKHKVLEPNLKTIRAGMDAVATA
jgi:hypothetical protein